MIISLIKQIEKYDIISFDIFDTLLIRPYVKPSDMFLHMERLLAIKSFAKKRAQAEEKARMTSKADEITLQEVYSFMDAGTRKALEFEIELEKRVCRRNEEIYSIYQYALEKKKRIIFVSDMYLPKPVLEEILANAGYVHREGLFISSEYFARKASGKLYDIVLDSMKIKPEQVLHIGDNRHSDIEMAESKGIKTFYYPKVINRFFEEYPSMLQLLRDKKDSRFKKDMLTLSILIGINSMVWIENQNDNYWTRLGSLYAGPFLYFFTKWIFDNAQSKGIKNIALVARDGYNLEKIMHILDQKKELNPRYVYLPRIVSESSNIKSVDDLEVFFNELGKSFDSLESFIMDFSRENRQIKLKWNEFRDVNKLPTYQDLKDFILSNSELFIKTSTSKRDTVIRYLDEMNLFTGDLMVVDSSCTKARPHKLLNYIINEKGYETRLFGYYYKVNEKQKDLNQTDIRPEVDRKYQTDKWDLMEFFMSSPESPIVSIKRQGKDYVPVYQNIENNPYEQVRMKASEWLTQGVMQFSDKAYDLFGELEFIKDLDTLILYINNLINNPSSQDISHIKHLHHSVNNDESYAPLILKDSQVERNLRGIYGQRVQVKRITPDFEHFFQGGFGFRLQNECNNNTLALNISFIDRNPSNLDIANVFRIKPDGTTEMLDTTTVWNFHHGAFLQFSPNNHDLVMFAFGDKNEEKCKSCILDLKSGNKAILDLPIVSLDAKGEKALGLQISRADDSPPGYLITPLKSISFSESKKRSDLLSDGIFLMDIDTGKSSLILSYQRLMEAFSETGGKLTDVDKMLIDHLDLNPSGSRILIVVSFVSKTDEHIDRLAITSDISGGNLNVLNTSVEIAGWKDDSTLAVIGFGPKVNSSPMSIKQERVSTLWEIDEISSEHRIVNTDFFMGNGYAAYSPNKQFIVFDSVPTLGIPYRRFSFYDTKSKKGIIIGYFYSDMELVNNIEDLRCFLYPHWSDCGDYITFNSIHEGYRAVYQVDVKELIQELDRNIESISEDEIACIVSYTPPVEKKNIYSQAQTEGRRNLKKVLRFLLRGPLRKAAKKLNQRFSILPE